MRTTVRDLRVVTVADFEPLRDFDAVFKSYAPYVASIALRLVGRDDDVDDIVQDVFLAAHGAIKDLREPGALKGWLRTITVRMSARKLRTRRLKAMLRLDNGSGYENIAHPGAHPDRRILLRRVYDVLDRLPVAERIAWTLRHVEGESIESVAELCRCSVATANRRIAAAHQRVRLELNDG